MKALCAVASLLAVLALLLVPVLAVQVSIEFNGGPAESFTSTYGEPLEVLAMGEGTVELYRNGTKVDNPDTTVLAAGTYHYVANSTGNQNYTSGSAEAWLTVEKAPTELKIYVDGEEVDGSITITYGRIIRVSAVIDREELQNQVAVDWGGPSDHRNPLPWYPPPGEWHLSASFAGNDNYTASSVEAVMIVEKVQTSTDLLVNGGRENLTVTRGSEVMFSVNSTGSGTVSLEVDDPAGSSVIAGQAAPYDFTYVFQSVGTFEVIAKYPEGYSDYGSESAPIYVTVVEPPTPPMPSGGGGGGGGGSYIKQEPAPVAEEKAPVPVTVPAVEEKKNEIAPVAKVNSTDEHPTKASAVDTNGAGVLIGCIAAVSVIAMPDPKLRERIRLPKLKFKQRRAKSTQKHPEVLAETAKPAPETGPDLTDIVAATKRISPLFPEDGQERIALEMEIARRIGDAKPEQVLEVLRAAYAKDISGRETELLEECKTLT